MALVQHSSAPELLQGAHRGGAPPSPCAPCADTPAPPAPPAAPLLPPPVSPLLPPVFPWGLCIRCRLTSALGWCPRRPARYRARLQGAAGAADRRAAGLLRQR
jgi:hypothetical protein